MGYGYGYDLKVANLSGIIVLILSFILTFLAGNLMNNVVSKWLMQRIAAVLLLPLLIWFLFNYDDLMTFSYSDAINFFDNKVNTTFLSLIFILAFFHMRIGMGEIFEDYIHNAAIKKAASAFILLISIIIPLVAITAMIILSL